MRHTSANYIASQNKIKTLTPKKWGQPYGSDGMGGGRGTWALGPPEPPGSRLPVGPAYNPIRARSA